MNGRLVPRAELVEDDRRAMYELFRTYFDGVTLEQFLSDLEQKNWVVLLKDDAGDIRGFTTILLYETTYDDERLNVVCSGDTVVDRDARMSSALAKTWLSSVDRFRREHAHGRFYWLLVCSGFRTYRFLPVFWREFHPRHDRPMPTETKALLDSLATGLFGDMYGGEAGIVRFPSPQILRDRVVPQRRMRDPHVSFFVSSNPGHVHGDELACITEISRENQTRVGLRTWALSPYQ